MSTANASYARPIPLRVRPDLIAERQRYQSRSFWVVKEPIGLKYFRFEEEEYAILRMLDGNASLQDIKEQFEREFAPEKTTFQNLQQFIGTLHRSGLVMADTPEQGLQLKQRRDEKRRKEMLGQCSNVLAVRFKGVDPERFLNWLSPYVRWVFSPVSVLAGLAIGLIALMIVVVNYEQFTARLPAFHEFFGPTNWLQIACVLGIVKVVHELGHGLTCKHFKGECHEIGFMLLVLTPCLYCNVSDSWLLPNKWHRAAIGAAGIFVELMLASIATFVWWFTDPGLTNHLALQVMFVCSVSTIFFNGNPLLRYDGYYILADILEVPNLRQKAGTVLKNGMARWCLGIELPEDRFLPQRNRVLFGFYTVAATCYRWFVLASILFFLNRVFEPYGLKIIGQMIAAMALFGLVVVPLWKLAKFLHVPGRIDQVKTKNLVGTLGVVATAVLVIGFLPLPRYVRCVCHVKHSDTQPVYVNTPGRLAEVRAWPGQEVRQGQVIGQLKNDSLQFEVKTLLAKRDELLAYADQLRRLQFVDRRAATQIPETLDAIAAVEEQLRDKKRQADALRITSPQTGAIVSPESRPVRRAREGELPQWSGTPFDERNTGVYLAKSDVFCLVGKPEAFEAELVIDQTDIDFMAKGQTVWLKFEAFAGTTIEATLGAPSPEDMKDMPRSLGNQAGGGVATVTDEGGVQRPLSTSYLAAAEIGTTDLPLQPGMRGKAKVFTGYESLAMRAWRFAARLFHFET